MDRSRSPRRQHLSWMQPPSSASGAAGVVLPASQLQWALPGIDFPLPPPPSSGKGVQAAAQSGFGPHRPNVSSTCVSQPSRPMTGCPDSTQSVHAKATGKGLAPMGQTQPWQTPPTAVGSYPIALQGKGTPEPPFSDLLSHQAFTAMPCFLILISWEAYSFRDLSRPPNSPVVKASQDVLRLLCPSML